MKRKMSFIAEEPYAGARDGMEDEGYSEDPLNKNNRVQERSQSMSTVRGLSHQEPQALVNSSMKLDVDDRISTAISSQRK